MPIRRHIRFSGIKQRNTIKNWANKKEKDENGVKTKKRLRPEFFGAITRLKAIQKLKLMNDGAYLGKSVNDKMFKFLLNANHGMIETQKAEVDHTSKGEKITGFNYVTPEAEG